MKTLVSLAVFFLALHLASLLAMWGFLPGGRTFYIVDGATLIPIVLGLRYFTLLRSRRASLTRLDAAVLFYLLISVASVVMYFREENPSAFEAYLYGIHLFVLPMSLYFGVKILPPAQQRTLLVWVCWMNFAAMVYGLYLHFERPFYYRDYLVGTVLEAKRLTEDWQIFSRLQSYLGSTAVGSVSAVTILLLGVCNVSPLILAMIGSSMVVSSFLSQQRGGILAALLAVTYVLVIKRSAVWVRVFIGVCVLLGVANFLGLVVERDASTVELWRERFSGGVGEAMAERGYGPGWDYLVHYPLGVGLGATSSAADSAGLASRGQVVDANFMRILADLGPQGLLAFLVVLALTVHAGLRRRNGIGWIMVPGCICLICVGTNTLDSHYVAHSFWAILGIIDSPDFAVVPRSRPAAVASAPKARAETGRAPGLGSVPVRAPS
jgi:hypothetical protein